MIREPTSSVRHELVGKLPIIGREGHQVFALTVTDLCHAQVSSAAFYSANNEAAAKAKGIKCVRDRSTAGATARNGAPERRDTSASQSGDMACAATATSERTTGSGSASADILVSIGPLGHVTLPGAIDDNAANLNFAESSLSDFAGRHRRHPQLATLTHVPPLMHAKYAVHCYLLTR